MSNSARLIIVYLTLTLLLGSTLGLTAVTVTGEERADRDRGNLREIWHLGLGTGLGELEAIAVGDVDNDGDDELIVGNGQGYLHIMEFDPTLGSQGGFVEEWQSVDMGGPVRALAVANIDDDDALEIAVGYNLDTKAGLVRVIDGITKKDEDNWTAGVGFLVSAQAAEIKPYGLILEDIDGDGEIELILGGDQGYIWVMDANTPEGENGDGDFFVKAHYDEGEWTRDLSYETGVTEENTFGVAVGDFDTDDDNLEIMVPTKDGDVVIYDGVNHEIQFEIKAGTAKAPGWNPFGGLGADLDGDGKDEFILGSDDNLIVYKGGQSTIEVVEPSPSITEVRGLEAVDLYGNNDPELVVVTNGGMIHILSYDGDELSIDQSWDSGEKFRGDGGGLAYLADGGDNGWLIHGGDMGVMRAWEVTSASQHEQVWSTDPADPLTPNGGPYSIVGGYAYGNTIGDLDDDGVNEVVVGSYQGRVLMFDGVTRELEWFSAILEGAVVGLEIADVTNDGELDLLVGTGDPFFNDDEGTEVYGKLHVYYNWNGDDFDNHYETPDDIESVWGIAVGELDGTTYPEIALAVARSYSVGSGTSKHTTWDGWLKIYGYDGSTFDEEFSTGDNDFDALALGVAIGDADNDGNNEAVVGVANNSQTMKGRIYTYDHNGATYTQGLNLATDNPSPFGLQVVDLDDDGEVEIVTGDAENSNTETYGRLTAYYYDGSSTTTKEFKNLGTSAAWGLWTGNMDEDAQLETIAGKKNGALLVFEAEEDPEDSNKIMLTKEESESTSLSTEAGFFGGINVGNLSGDDRNEIVVGSSSYVWVFGLEGDLDKPDLEVANSRIYFDPEEPTDEEDVKISVIVRNLGTVAIDEWRVIFYDGEPLPRNQIAVYPHAGQDPGVLVPGGQMNISRIWYADPTLPPGDHNITMVAEDAQSPQKETRETNNLAWATLFVEEIPNDAPVAVGSISKDSVWKNEAFTLFAGESHDTEDTDGLADNEDSVSDLSYSYFPKSGESGWTTFLAKREFTFEFESSGTKMVKFQVRDSKRKLSEILSFEVEVVTNTEPVSDLTTNATPDPNNAEIFHDEYINLDASGSYDPNHRTQLEYKFATDNTDGGEAWVSEWGKNDAFVTFTRMGVTLKDGQGKTRQFKIVDGTLSFNYTLENDETTRTFFPQVLVKEIPPPISQDEPLESDWTIAGNVSITVSRPPNHPPTVQAAVMKEADSTTQTDDLEVPKFEAVTFLVASKSDPDGDPISFTWTIPDSPGSAATHTYAGSATDGSWGWSFDELGTYVITLTANDGRDGITTDTVTVRVVETPDTGSDCSWGPICDIADKSGLPEPIVLMVIVLPILLGIAGAAVMHGRAGGKGEYDYSEAATSGVTLLTCPTCASSIEVATPQRPVRVSCGGCASEFILRE